MSRFDIPEPAQTDGDASWFVKDRFGLFIHWGLYSLGARHEWLKRNEKLTDEEYEKYFRHFDPDLYDPELWADLAQEAGMKYFVVTTKHHEGFCLWDSKLTDYKAPKTPAGRDLLRPMVDAFRGRGMKVGFYYSLLDWHHPDYTTDQHHPQAEVPSRIAADKERDLARYAKYLHGQTEELMTNFGHVDILWYDFSIAEANGLPGKGKDEWRSEELIAKIRILQPKILLNDRLQIDQDFKTPEQFSPESWVTVEGRPVVWEACHTFSGSWGYHRDEASWKSVDLLVRMLIDSVSKGGNFLLNVGPTGRGEFDQRVIDRLKGMGVWMKSHSRSIYGCTQAPSEFKAPTDVRYTFNPSLNRLYVHLFAYPFYTLLLPGLGGKVEYAQFLNDGSEVRIREDVPEWQFGAGVERQGDDKPLILQLPSVQPNHSVPVIELFLR